MGFKRRVSGVAPGPAQVAVPRWEIRLESTGGNGATNRVGGAPTAWKGADWPKCTSCGQPQTFLYQLISKKLGGVVSIGPHAALQVFACREWDDDAVPCQPEDPSSGCNAALLRRSLGRDTAPALGDPVPPRAMVLVEGADDARLIRTLAERQRRTNRPATARPAPSESFASEQERDDAFGHALVDKIGGVETCGNPPSAVHCRACGAEMKFIAQIYDGVLGETGLLTTFVHVCPRWHEAAYQANR